MSSDSNVTLPIPLLVIVGPTAAGKTDLSIEVADRLKAEIVSADSMQVYRRMDIGTAKPNAEQRARVPHHLIDIVDPQEDYSVARYQAEATEAIALVAGKGSLPILVGGTGFYLHAVVEGWKPPAAAPDSAYRRELHEVLAHEGPTRLHQRLQTIDPERALRVHPHDVKRVIRALEVFHATARPVSSFPAMWNAASPTDQSRLDQTPSNRYNAVTVGVTRARERLCQRIDGRIDAMLSAGFLEEVMDLKAHGCHRGMTSMQGLGYRHALSFLEGAVEADTMTRLWKRDTRRYAKRQLTWFRRDSRIQWIDLEAITEAQAIEGVVQTAARLWKPHVQGP